MMRINSTMSASREALRCRSVVIFHALPVAIVVMLSCLCLTLCAQAPQLGRPVELPTEREGVRRIFLEVRLAETEPVRGLTIEARVTGSGTKTYVHYATLITNADVSKAAVVESDGRYNVSVVLTPAGKAKMIEGTSKHRGRPLAIILDGEIVSLLTVRSPLSDTIVIPGAYTREEATRISSGLVW
jgi:hypothetical protein